MADHNKTASDNVKKINKLLNDSIFQNDLFKTQMDLGEYTNGVDNRSFYNFNRFRLVGNQDPLQTNIAYVFFTKPDMSFNDTNTVGGSEWVNSDKDSYLNMMTNRSRENTFGRYILSNLSSSYRASFNKNEAVPGSFIKMLSNSVLNFESIDNQLRIDDSFQNYYGIKITTPNSMMESFSSNTINFNFREYSDLRITHLFKIWVEYIHNIRLGVFAPKDEYRLKKIIDYACSIYYFLCGPDGHEIVYYCKLTGCFPVNIPYSSMSWNFGGGNGIKDLNIQFQYQLKEDMNPDIISDFNLTSIGSISPSSDLKTNLEDRLKDNWASKAFIDLDGKLQFI